MQSTAAPDAAPAAFAPMAAPGPSHASSSLGATAFTQGSDVSFSSSSPGLATAAHEAAHVVQQRSAAPFEGMY